MDFVNSISDLFQNLTSDRPWVAAAFILLAFVAVAKIVDWLFTGVVKAWSRRTATSLDDRLIEILHRPVFFSVVLAGLWLAVDRLQPSEATATLVLRLLKTVGLLLWFAFATKAARLLLDVLSHSSRTAPWIESRTVALLDNTAKLILLGAAVYLFCLSWGIDVGGWLVSAGVLGLVLGLAAKDTLANLFAGLFILADAPYEVGNFINLDSGERGEVTQIGLRSTRLLTRDDIEITVPNSVIANAKIINETGGRWQRERVRVKVSVAYGSDLEQVRTALLEIAKNNAMVEEDPEPRVRLRALGDSALEMELLCWIPEPVFRGRVLDSLLEQVYLTFSERGIEIPYPQRDIHLYQKTPKA